MKTAIKGRVKTQIINASTGEIVKDNPFRENLFMDRGLNSLAIVGGVGCSMAGCFSNMIVGGGNSANSVASGAVTFTQSGTTLTASGSFFTSGMVGTLFKYGTGTGGAEYYITAFSNATTVTVDTAATVTTPTVGTVWFVNKTALDTPLGFASSYDVTAGSNSTTYTGSQVTFQRVFIIATQGSPYTVNEIGYNQNNIGTTTNVINGRFVLSSSDVVGTGNFYRVTIQLIFVLSPSAPTAVVNVGTNINTAGTAMIESWTEVSKVNTDGTSSAPGNGGIDGFSVGRIGFLIGTYSQNTSILTGAFAPPSNIAQNAGAWTSAGTRGKCTSTTAFSQSTTGQTCYGICFGDLINNKIAFDILFTTPQTLPTGTFAGTVIFQNVYDRQLSN